MSVSLWHTPLVAGLPTLCTRPCLWNTVLLMLSCWCMQGTLLSCWRLNLSVLASTAQYPPDIGAILRLGDRLGGEGVQPRAAQVCYLVAGATPSFYPGSGMTHTHTHTHTHTARHGASPPVFMLCKPD